MKKHAANIANPPNFGFEAARWSIFAILILTYILVYFHRMAPAPLFSAWPRVCNAPGRRIQGQGNLLPQQL